MDADTKVLSSILVGLGAVVFIIIGSMIAVSLFNQPDKPKRIATAEKSIPDTFKTANLSIGDADNVGALQSIKAVKDVAKMARNTSFKVYEGHRSTFNPEQAFEPGEVVLADPPSGFEDKIRPAGFRVTEHVNLGKLGLTLVRISTPPGLSVPDALKKIGAILPGAILDANHQYEESAFRTAKVGDNPREMAGWEKLSPTCGTGLVLGQIDSGVDMTHPALSGQKVRYKAFTKSGRKPGPPEHGTAVASMLVGKAEWGGLVPGARLYAANMFEINEKGKKVGSSISLMKAIDWMASQKVHAVNLSIAGSDNKVVRRAFDLAKKADLMLVAAVGNWGRADKPAYPAAYNHVIAVTATRGKELIYSHANQGKYVDFAAPGVAIYTALPGGGGKPQSGTSFAAPYITVITAILSKAGKVQNANDLRRMLSKATRDLGRPGKDSIFGYGYVKARPACK